MTQLANKCLLTKKQKQIGQKFKAENLKGTSIDVDERNYLKERGKKRKEKRIQ